MITELGITAGDIWHFLDDHGRSTVSQLLGQLDKPRDTVLMSVGWLAREGHVTLEPEGSDYAIQLRKSA